MKHKVINGWTRERMKEAIRAGNNGTPAMDKVDGIGGCLYLTPDGNKCAVGCFIPDEHPGQDVAGAVGELLGRYQDLAGLMPLRLSGLSELQMLHDDIAFGRYPGRGDTRDALCIWIDENCED